MSLWNSSERANLLNMLEDCIAYVVVGINFGVVGGVDISTCALIVLVGIWMVRKDLNGHLYDLLKL